jgi:hypothetical protein
MDKLALNPQDMMSKYRAVFAQGRGVAWDKKQTFNERHNIPVTDVAAWIKTNLAPDSSL